jgi:hypothetical protein
MPALLLASTPSLSQATLDRLLATVSVDKKGNCSVIDIRLNRPVGYVRHFPDFPTTAGRNLVVNINPLGTTAGNEDTTERPVKEAASIPVGNSAGLDGVSYDPNATGGPEIHLSFSKSVVFRVVMDSNTRHLRVDVATPKNAKNCFGLSETQSETPTNELGKADLPSSSGSDAAAAYADGQAQLREKNYARATAFFTKAVSIGAGKVKQDAQEMLGLSRERAGQLPHAQAEYKLYLENWPKSPGAGRVRTRLDAVRAAMDQAAEQEFNARRAALTPAEPQNGKSSLETPSASKSADAKEVLIDTEAVVDPDIKTNQATKVDAAQTPHVVTGGLIDTGNGLMLNSKEPVKDPNAWTWDLNGSLAQYYYRNDNFSSTDPGSQKFDRHDVYQNEVFSTADAFLRGQNPDYDIELRTSLFNETGLGEMNDIQSTSIGTAYADLKSKNTGLSTRLGRQSKSTGGVFGRFDGALLGWQLNKEMKLSAYTGSPVYSRDAKPFADKRVFYGANVDYIFPGDEWAGSIYGIAQDISGIIDRRAVGTELRYNSKKVSVYSAVDYDLYFREINNAYLSTNWRVNEGTTIHGNVDFRRVPFLLTENALMGQNVDDLETLVSIWGDESVYQFALDRTASAKTLSGGISQELSENWQVSVDGTLAEYSGTPASGGVDAIPPPGMEYYVSGQLNGTNMLRENDTITFGLRYSGSKTSNFYMADAYYRFPVSEDLRISPRIRFSLRDSKTTDQKQYVVVPSVASRYRVNKSWSFETEIGMRWEYLVTSVSTTQSVNVSATAGYRFEF